MIFKAQNLVKNLAEENELVVYWVVFGAYLVFLAVAGIRAKKKTNTLQDFMVAGRNIGPVLLALSYGATYFSAVLLVGGGEYAYNWGLSALMIAFGNVVVGILAMFLLFGRRTVMLSHHYECLTISQMLAKRYDSDGLRYLTSISILIFETVYLVSIYMGLTVLLEIILPGVENAPVWAVCIVGLITIFYLSISGSHGAITTDVVESIIMIIGVLAISITALVAVGGFSGFLETLANIELDAGIKPGNLTNFPGQGGFAVIGFVLVTSFGTWGLPQMISRFFTADKKKSTLKRGLVISLIWATVISFLAYFNGALGRVYFFENPDPTVVGANVVPKMMVTILPIWLASLFIAAVTAASLTTGEKVILMAAGSLSIDTYQHITKASDEKTFRVTKLTTVLIVVVAVILTIIKPDAVLALAMFAWSAIAGTILVPYVGGLFWKRGTAAGAIACAATALVSTVLWWLCFRSGSLNASLNTDIFPLLKEWVPVILFQNDTITITVGSIHEFIVSQVLSVIVYIVVSLLTKVRNPEEVEKIFEIMTSDDESEKHEEEPTSEAEEES